MKIKTLCGKKIDITTPHKYDIVDSDGNYPHWGWLVVSLLLFWPAMFIWFGMGWLRKKYNVEICRGNTCYEVWLDQSNFDILSNHARQK